MSKVKITKEQEGAIKEWTMSESAMGKCLKLHSTGELSESKCLYELSTIELAKAFIEGYEVTEEYKVGEWVKSLVNGSIGTVTQVGSDYLKYDNRYSNKLHAFRHATEEEVTQEKERRFFAKHGREPWELKQGDLLSRNNASYTVWLVEADRVVFNEFAIIRTWEDVKENFRVSCFVEQRMDK